MTALFAVSLVIGVVCLLVLVAAVAVAETVSGWERVDPDVRFGRGGRLIVAGLNGFGLGGMSATYAGWPAAATLAAAAGGVVLAGWAALYLAGDRETA